MKKRLAKKVIKISSNPKIKYYHKIKYFFDDLKHIRCYKKTWTRIYMPYSNAQIYEARRKLSHIAKKQNLFFLNHGEMIIYNMFMHEMA